MDRHRNPEAGGRVGAVAYLAGFLTASLIATACVAFVGSRIGFTALAPATSLARSGPVLDMPSELIDELAAMNAVIDNADNPTGARKHDTLIVQPDEEFEKKLRPGTSVDAYQIRAGDALNFDPPVVYTPADATLSEPLRSYLAANARVRYSYNIDSGGFRHTLPPVTAARQILVVGDSATFGVGVDDGDTVPSALQRLVGDSYRVVNAGVPGFDADQCFRVARRLAEEQDFSILVYFAHANDFLGEGEDARGKVADETITHFASLAGRFPEGIVVAFFVPLEYAVEDVLLSDGWDRDKLDSLTRLRARLADRARQAKLPFIDWGDILPEIRGREKTIFAPWSYYVDHSHLSPRGTRTLAEHIYTALSARGLQREHELER